MKMKILDYSLVSLFLGRLTFLLAGMGPLCQSDQATGVFGLHKIATLGEIPCSDLVMLFPEGESFVTTREREERIGKTLKIGRYRGKIESK